MCPLFWGLQGYASAGGAKWACLDSRPEDIGRHCWLCTLGHAMIWIDLTFAARTSEGQDQHEVEVNKQFSAWITIHSFFQRTKSWTKTCWYCTRQPNHVWRTRSSTDLSENHSTHFIMESSVWDWSNFPFLSICEEHWWCLWPIFWYWHLAHCWRQPAHLVEPRLHHFWWLKTCNPCWLSDYQHRGNKEVWYDIIKSQKFQQSSAASLGFTIVKAHRFVPSALQGTLWVFGRLFEGLKCVWKTKKMATEKLKNMFFDLVFDFVPRLSGEGCQILCQLYRLLLLLLCLLPAPDGSVLHRTSTASSRWHPHRTSTASPRGQCSPLDLNCPNLCQVECQNICQIECQNLCQIEYQINVR